MTERSTQSITELVELFRQGTKHVSELAEGLDIPLIEADDRHLRGGRFDWRSSFFASEGTEPIEHIVGSVGSAGGQS